MKKLLISIGCVLLFVIVIVTFIYVTMNKPYSEIINTNWSIELPNSYKQIYSADSGASFHGDGQRYHIFEYKNEEEIKLALNWENVRNDTLESTIKKILNTLNVSSDNRPNFDDKYKYYSIKKKDSSEIYLIFNNDAKKLYIIEDIL